jgi:hypothetical protein
MATIKVDLRRANKMFDNMEDLPKDAMSDAYPFLKKSTPKRSGNARNKTKLRDTRIESRYGYAGRLDEGWSQQAPKGFTDPTIKQLDVIVDKLTKRV